MNLILILHSDPLFLKSKQAIKFRILTKKSSSCEVNSIRLSVGLTQDWVQG